MGTFVTIILALGIGVAGIYGLKRTIEDAKAGKCTGCSGCDIDDCTSRTTEFMIDEKSD